MENKPEQKVERTGKSQWPAWFPYPSSWLLDMRFNSVDGDSSENCRLLGVLCRLICVGTGRRSGSIAQVSGNRYAAVRSGLFLHSPLPIWQLPPGMAGRVAQPQKLVGRLLRPNCNAALLSGHYHNFCAVFTARQLLLSKPQTAKLRHANAPNGVR